MHNIENPAQKSGVFLCHLIMRKIAIQGVKGCYHDIAAQQFFPNEELSLIECLRFEDIFEAIKKDKETTGILAIENTIAGSLLPNHELLKLSNTRIVGEQKLRISHCIACLPTDDWSTLQIVQSHPVALMQCQEFLNKHSNLIVKESVDTALSAKEITLQKLNGQAAICSEEAALLHGLKILEKGIESDKHNYTRFLIVQSKSTSKPIQPKFIQKASLVFTLPHRLASLSTVLSVLSFYGMNLTKIQSLPIIGREWEYQFYTDIAFQDYQAYKQALAAIQTLTTNIKILGEYEEGKHEN